MNKIIVLGTSNDVTDCECCGKTNLKRTVVLDFGDGDIRYYGCDCAGTALYGKKTSRNSDAIRKNADLLGWLDKAVRSGVSKEIAYGGQGFYFDAKLNAWIRGNLRIAA